MVPVLSLVSDNISIYVSDLRNKITQYPGGKIYDFESPLLFFNSSVFMVENYRIFVKTKEALGLFYENSEPIKELFFSDKGGLIFMRGKSVTKCLDSSTLEIKGDYYLDEAIAADESLINVGENGLEVLDLFIDDCAFSGASFRKVEIKEKKVDRIEHEEKYTFIDDGNKKYLPKEKPIKNKRIVEKENISNDSEEEILSKKFNSKRNSHLEELFSDEVSIESPQKENVAFQAKRLAFNPSSYEGTDANLLFYSNEGFMVSIQSPVSNLVSVKYHDNIQMPLEIKDTNKCKKGAFYKDKFVLSNGSVINYNDEWTKEIKAELIGISSKNIFVFDKTLKILDFKGEILQEIYLADFFTFSCSSDCIAVFGESQMTYIEDVDQSGFEGPLKVDYIPIKNVVFSCFDTKGILYVKTDEAIFKLSNRLFIKVMDLKSIPLTVCDNYLVSLSNSRELLPKPSVDYNEIKNKVPEKIDFKPELTGSYNPLKNNK